MTGHVWDDNGVCQIHGGYCSMAPTETPQLAVPGVDEPVPYRLTAAAPRLLDSEQPGNQTHPFEPPAIRSPAHFETGSTS